MHKRYVFVVFLILLYISSFSQDFKKKMEESANKSDNSYLGQSYSEQPRPENKKTSDLTLDFSLGVYNRINVGGIHTDYLGEWENSYNSGGWAEGVISSNGAYDAFRYNMFSFSFGLTMISHNVFAEYGYKNIPNLKDGEGSSPPSTTIHYLNIGYQYLFFRKKWPFNPHLGINLAMNRRTFRPECDCSTPYQMWWIRNDSKKLYDKINELNVQIPLGISAYPSDRISFDLTFYLNVYTFYRGYSQITTIDYTYDQFDNLISAAEEINRYEYSGNSNSEFFREQAATVFRFAMYYHLPLK